MLTYNISSSNFHLLIWVCTAPPPQLHETVFAVCSFYFSFFWRNHKFAHSSIIIIITATATRHFCLNWKTQGDPFLVADSGGYNRATYQANWQQKVLRIPTTATATQSPGDVFSLAQSSRVESTGWRTTNYWRHRLRTPTHFATTFFGLSHLCLSNSAIAINSSISSISSISNTILAIRYRWWQSCCCCLVGSHSLSRSRQMSNSSSICGPRLRSSLGRRRGSSQMTAVVSVRRKCTLCWLLAACLPCWCCLCRGIN